MQHLHICIECLHTCNTFTYALSPHTQHLYVCIECLHTCNTFTYALSVSTHATPSRPTRPSRRTRWRTGPQGHYVLASHTHTEERTMWKRLPSCSGIASKLASKLSARLKRVTKRPLKDTTTPPAYFTHMLSSESSREGMSTSRRWWGCPCTTPPTGSPHRS